MYYYLVADIKVLHRHWPAVSKLLSDNSKETIWIFAVRSTLLKEHKEKLSNLLSNSTNIHCYELIKTDPNQKKADNFDEILNNVFNIIGKSEVQ